jgi:hypothetical protein
MVTISATPYAEPKDREIHGFAKSGGIEPATGLRFWINPKAIDPDRGELWEEKFVYKNNIIIKNETID